MTDEIPEHIRNLTRLEVMRAVREGWLQAKNLDGTPFTFPPSEIPAKPNPRQKPKLSIHKTVEKRSRNYKMRVETYSNQNAQCYYCNHHKRFELWTLDHKIPVSRGGKEGNNIVGACSMCNTLKACLTVEEFLEVRHDQKLLKSKVIAMTLEIAARKDREYKTGKSV